MTPCQRLKHLLYDFAEGELGEAYKQEVQSHIDECPDCSGFVRQLRALRTRLREIKPVQTSDDFVLRLRSRIRQEAAEQSTASQRLFGNNRWIPAVGLTLLLIASGFLVVDRTSWNSGQDSSAGKTASAQKGSTRSQAPNTSELNESEQIQNFRSTTETNQVVAQEDTVTIEEDDLDEVKSRIRAVSY